MIETLDVEKGDYKSKEDFEKPEPQFNPRNPDNTFDAQDPEADYEVDENGNSLDDSDTDDSSFNLRKKIMVVLAVVTLILLVLLVSGAFGGSDTSTSPQPESGSHKKETPAEKIKDGDGNEYTILETYSRSGSHYTQGLYFLRGQLVESTGLYGESEVLYWNFDEENKRLVEDKKIHMSRNYFGEGLDIVKDPVSGKEVIFQLTWKERTVYKYDLNLKVLKEFTLPSQIEQGWGLTHKPDEPSTLYVSDSTDILRKVDISGNKFHWKENLPITRNNQPLEEINEMEWVGDFIVANVYLTRQIVIIDPQSKKVVRTIDMEELYKRATKKKYLNHGECLNGIAYDAQKEEFYLTGKHWSLVFKLKMPAEYFKRA